MNTANDHLPETKFFRIQRCAWMDNNGRKYFHIQPKRELTSKSKAMIGTLPGAHWNLEALADLISKVEKSYADNRRTLEANTMSDFGSMLFEIGKAGMGAA